MKTIAITMLCFALASCMAAKSTAADSIDTFVAKLNTTHGLWINGAYPIINLPSGAKLGQVLAEAIKMTTFDQGRITSYKIQTIKQVELIAAGRQTFSAALVESNLGPKIFLFKPETNNQWWTRFYDVPEEKQNK